VKAPAEAEAHTQRVDSSAVDPDVAAFGWRASPNKRKHQLLGTRLADLTVGDLVKILEDLELGQRLRERGLL